MSLKKKKKKSPKTGKCVLIFFLLIKIKVSWSVRTVPWKFLNTHIRRRCFLSLFNLLHVISVTRKIIWVTYIILTVTTTERKVLVFLVTCKFHKKYDIPTEKCRITFWVYSEFYSACNFSWGFFQETHSFPSIHHFFPINFFISQFWGINKM